MTLHERMAMSDLQRYPWNINLIKNVEDTVVFLTGKVYLLLLINKTLGRKHGSWLGKTCKSTDVNWILLRESLEITLTVPLMFFNFITIWIIKALYSSNCFALLEDIFSEWLTAFWNNILLKYENMFICL